MSDLVISVEGMDEILEKLDAFSRKEQNKIIKKSVNETLKYLHSLTKKQLAKTYIRTQKQIDATLTDIKATASNGTAKLVSKGDVLEPLDYKASPTTMAQQQHRKMAAKLKVKRDGSMKPLVLNDEDADRKAFLTELPWKNKKTGESGKHLAIVQRKGKDRFPIRKLLSSSVPGLLGANYKTALQPMARQNLADNLNRHIEEVLKR